MGNVNDRLFGQSKFVDAGYTQDTYTLYGYTGTDQTSQTVYQGDDNTGTIQTTTSYTYDVTGAMTGVSIATTG